MTIPEAMAQAQTLLMSGRSADAAALYRQILSAAPQHPTATGFLALALWDAGQDTEAATRAEEALQSWPDSPPAHCAAGLVHYRQQRPQQAMTHLQQAVAGWPDLIVAHQHLGLCYNLLGRHEEAMRHFEVVCRLQPDHQHARFSRGMIWLTHGRYHDGWIEYEWRWLSAKLPRPEIPRPRWDGSDPTGKGILVHTEQGIGDVLQCIRLLPLLKARGARIVFACQEALHQLLADLPSVDEWMPIGRPASINFDYYVPLLALPGIFNIDEQNMPREVPYVHPKAELVEQWRPKVEALSGFKVGLCWQGSPTFIGDKFRSIPLTHYAPLAAVPGVKLVSLQKGHGTEQMATCGFPVTAFEGMDETAGPLMDAAAIMKQLDLVITSDTAIAHLAGSMGVPVWVAISTGADWRWGVDREDNAWYPTLRVFRQSELGEWTPVFARIAAELRRVVESGGPVPPPPASPAVPPTAAVSVGELFDKITILEIKSERMTDSGQLTNVRRELTALRAVSVPSRPGFDALVAELKAVNGELWDIEDGIRDCDRAGDFGPKFVDLARSVYRTNDRRSALKRRINELLGSALVEEKSYARHESN